MTDCITPEYLSTGGNRHSGAADWSSTTSRLAFGADQNVGIWSPLSDSGRGISDLLSGHTAKVTAVRFLAGPKNESSELLVTGSANGEIAVWGQNNAMGRLNCLNKVAAAHEGTVNTIASFSQSDIFVTGGVDAKIKVWKFNAEKIEALAIMPLKPRLIPLTVAIGPFTSALQQDSAFVVVGGTRNDIQVYALEGLVSTPQVKLCATLTGHEAWIRSLALTPTSDGGFLLASASQDKYVRIWRFHSSHQTSTQTPAVSNGTSPSHSTLTAKIQTVSTTSRAYSITFEALLLGHEDWIYSATWSPNTENPQLLTASADGSLSIWEADTISGIWLSISRLGEISGQKGATTATGSAGGFWTGLWSPDGKSVACLGRTGSWRLWTYDGTAQFWTQRYGISGHVASVNGIAWSPCGNYLLSTSSDQTTRLHAEWKRGSKRSWHEFSRPQIHGYDLNCIATVSPHQFSSGADEKLLRVFNEPKDIANMLHRLCGVPLPPEAENMPDTAAIPVLGLSNKAMEEGEQTNGDAADPSESADQRNGIGPSLLDITEPPTEDLLARHTLWPEHEKLYGHGSEITEAATPSDGSVLATACKASSVDHAVIRLYDTKIWTELKPPLSAHALTVTRLAFSQDLSADYLLSVGRDRQWAVYKREESDAKSWNRVAINPKAHSRMILDATWLAGPEQPSFVTAGRDKTVKIWSSTPDAAADEFTMRASIARKSPVTAVSATTNGTASILAIGEDDGSISLYAIEYSSELSVKRSIEVPRQLCPSKTVNRLAWKPRRDSEEDEGVGQLAVASADGSVRILRIHVAELARE
ncbi:Elongator subunit elp2 [Cladophialophora chaetospira]|uniref:Elongator complex protein 2 n=1 Tax=Cladophialophora chaetospira TaxID=386627 RepID=A0AA38XFX8_9EURO|nr:Elongator subunit elp2 [Cladophialophora chaetospira]